jgi:hypothetical protein
MGERHAARGSTPAVRSSLPVGSSQRPEVMVLANGFIRLPAPSLLLENHDYLNQRHNLVWKEVPYGFPFSLGQGHVDL